MPVRPGALVQVQEVAHALEVRGEAGDGGRDRLGEIRVAGDEQVGPAVAVDVRHRCPRVPAEGVDAGGFGALAERAVAVVPEELVVGRRRDEQVRVPVAVEVRGDAAVPLDGEVGVRAPAHVHERPLDVVEERAPREAAVALVAGAIGARVRVHDEQVEPAVAVVVEPAEPASHHRARYPG